MVLSVDLENDPRVMEVLTRARELYETANTDWEALRARVLARVESRKYATGDWFYPLNPVGPETFHGSRGRLTEDPEQAHQIASFDAAGQLIMVESNTTGPGKDIDYLEWDSAGWTHWIYEELASHNWHRVASVRLGRWLRPSEDYIVCGKGGGETRTYVRYESKTRLEMWQRPNRGGIEHFEADLDPNGHPTRVVRNGHVIFEKRRGNLDQELLRLKKAMLREIPKRIAAEHAGHELYAVCLSYGLGEELLPPAIIPCRVEDYPKLAAKPGQHWDAGPLWDLREPIHVGDTEAIAKLVPPILLHLDEEGAFEKIQAMLVDLARELNHGKWPKGIERAAGFVVYAANVEDGDWQWQLEAVLDEPTAAILRDKGWLPDGVRAREGTGSPPAPAPTGSEPAVPDTAEAKTRAAKRPSPSPKKATKATPKAPPASPAAKKVTPKKGSSE